MSGLMDPRSPDLTRTSFARTNAETVRARVDLLRELLPGTTSIAEICCGDCARQHAAYTEAFPGVRYRGLDLAPAIVRANRLAGIDCVPGDALDADALRPFLGFDVVFFGPPLSEDCDGHRLLAFAEVRPSFSDFARVFVGTLGYRGTLIVVAPKTTTLGDARWLYERVRPLDLRLVHRSHSTRTGSDAETGPRLKYVELWFSSSLGDLWEVRETGTASRG
jgi:hypothetical protein